MPAELHISSLVVHARPEALDAVQVGIDTMAGAEVHGRSPAGKIVVTLESPDEAGILERLADIRALPGVLSAALVFHQVDRPEPTREA